MLSKHNTLLHRALDLFRADTKIIFLRTFEVIKFVSNAMFTSALIGQISPSYHDHRGQEFNKHNLPLKWSRIDSHQLV